MAAVRVKVREVSTASTLAPVPDFRYVGLEPIPTRRLGVAATAFGLGAGMAIAMSGIGTRDALVAGMLTSLGSVYAMRRAGATTARSGTPRMGIVPWGVLVEEVDTPRILRWAGVRRVDVVSSRARHSRVVVETESDRFIGESVGAVRLDRLVEHLDAYAAEQARPLALDLAGERDRDALEVHEPCCEALLEGAAGWLESARAVSDLDLPPAGYRTTSVHAASATTVEVLRRVLCDRTPKEADPRAFAAVIAAEVRACELAPELIALTQCPHPIVAAVAKQAARKLGVAKARTGTLDEVAPFLHDGDRARLDAWARS
jgi:hypothetical protein